MLSKKSQKIKSFIAMDVLEASQKLQGQGHDIISFGLGEPDFDAPEVVKEACIKAIRDNKTKYIDPLTGKKLSNKIKDDIKKLFTAFSISEAIFILSKTYIHYSLLSLSVQPYQAYTFAEFISWIIYLISINAGTKTVKLFDN